MQGRSGAIGSECELAVAFGQRLAARTVLLAARRDAQMSYYSIAGTEQPAFRKALYDVHCESPDAPYDDLNADEAMASRRQAALAA